MYFAIKIKSQWKQRRYKNKQQILSHTTTLEIEKESNLGIHVSIGRTKIGEGLYPSITCFDEHAHL